MSDQAGKSMAPVIVAVSGDFSFTVNGGFRGLLGRYPKGERAFVVDLGEVESLDSSALGMLLQLRDHSRNGDRVSVINPSAVVRAALSESELGRLFPVAEA